AARAPVPDAPPRPEQPPQPAAERLGRLLAPPVGPQAAARLQERQPPPPRAAWPWAAGRSAGPPGTGSGGPCGGRARRTRPPPRATAQVRERTPQAMGRGAMFDCGQEIMAEELLVNLLNRDFVL